MTYMKTKKQKPMRATKRKEKDTRTESRASIIAQKSMLVSMHSEKICED